MEQEQKRSVHLGVDFYSQRIEEANSKLMDLEDKSSFDALNLTETIEVWQLKRHQVIRRERLGLMK